MDYTVILGQNGVEIENTGILGYHGTYGVYSYLCILRYRDEL